MQPRNYKRSGKSYNKQDRDYKNKSFKYLSPLLNRKRIKLKTQKVKRNFYAIYISLLLQK